MLFVLIPLVSIVSAVPIPISPIRINTVEISPLSPLPHSISPPLSLPHTQPRIVTQYPRLDAPAPAGLFVSGRSSIEAPAPLLSRDGVHLGPTSNPSILAASTKPASAPLFGSVLISQLKTLPDKVVKLFTKPKRRNTIEELLSNAA